MEADGLKFGGVVFVRKAQVCGLGWFQERDDDVDIGDSPCSGFVFEPISTAWAGHDGELAGPRTGDWEEIGFHGGFVMITRRGEGVNKTIVLFGVLMFCTSENSLPQQPTQTYELEFWPGPNVEKDPRVVSIHEHPCGEAVTAKVKVMPSFRKGGALESEEVVELSASGQVMRRWPIPVDSSPKAVKGNELLVSAGDWLIWVTPSGVIRRERSRKTFPEPASGNCQASKEFGESGYATCGQFKDLGSARVRRISYEGVCT